MEEELLKILAKHYQFNFCNKRCAKEIAYHFSKFIEWWMDENNDTITSTIIYDTNGTLDDVYNYYRLNVLKK